MSPSYQTELQNSTSDTETPVSAIPVHLKSRLKESYDAIAPRYNEWTANTNSTTRNQYLSKLLDQLSIGKRSTAILELGCGAGIPVTQTLLSHPNITVTANDLSSTQIALAKQNLASVGGERVNFIETDMMALSLPVQAFDAVIALYSIIHLPRDEQITLLQRMAKWMKPGAFLLANFAKEDLPGKETQAWLGEKKGWMFWSGWGVDRTIEIIEDAGLKVLMREVVGDVSNAEFLWIIAQRPVCKE